MIIYLGNMRISEIEFRAGIVFPEAPKDYMEPRHQASANSVKTDKWHCFDIPFVLVCGDIDTATVIHNHLKPFSNDFKEPLRIALNEKQ